MSHDTRSPLHALIGRRYSLLLTAVTLAACQEDSTGPSAPDATQSVAAASAGTLTFGMVTTGGQHSCGLTLNGRAYCWGLNRNGELGDGTRTDRTRPTVVAGGLVFSALSAAEGYTCGLTTVQRAYCWGWNDLGMLGDGTRVDRSRPVAVKGGLLFRQIRGGSHHTCGVTTTDKAYCWGRNQTGELGIGVIRGYRLVPKPVAGGLSFRRVIAGGAHTCGLTTGGRAYCWGNGNVGQLGNGETVFSRPAPSPVLGGLTFTQVVAGYAHSCGVTTGKRAYCWGDNREGKLGDGTDSDMRLVPRPVAGGLLFKGVSTLGHHTCGVSTEQQAWCWGFNNYGQVGVQSSFPFRVASPVRVPGGITFSSIGGGLAASHTCGLTPGGAAYCWGGNYSGQLGDGTTTSRSNPRTVVSPS
jgi:alpha-tubulin suppressor-like RCC1 family protein